MNRILWLLMVFITLTVASATAGAQGRTLDNAPELADFFEAEVTKLERSNELTRFETLADWEREKPILRQQLFDMLGLDPLPLRLPLQPVVTGVVEHPEFVVERLHFQSLPGLYVTGNLYRPVKQEGPLPTVLYVCGHGQVKQDGISFGNKTHYQHHGAWFARNGYVCLTIDTLQLGEIEGVHHGTHRLNRWWWNSRGYTPAGVEAWNCMRALDYLETRPEVDASRFGVTGRSGGGAYSWWIAALDDRIRCAVPVAGITSLRDHVVNGCVEGHCDCMYFVNTFRWDYAKLAALVAPRPLLISNTDKDPIFPLEGVVDIHRQVRHVYQLYKAGDKLGLQITEGPHADTQELHLHAFRWFNRHFRNDLTMIEKTAVKFFEPPQLRVFADLPQDEVNTRIDEQFVAAAPSLSEQQLSEPMLLENITAKLLDRCFRAWPEAQDVSGEVRVEAGGTVQVNGTEQSVSRLTFESQPYVALQMDVLHGAGVELQNLQRLVLVVVPGGPLPAAAAEGISGPVALLSLRPGVHGPWPGNDAKQIQIQRRFQLLGMTLDGMRVWDIRRGLQVLRQQCPQLQSLEIRCAGGSEALVLLASLYEPPVSSIVVPELPLSEPAILNFSRTMSPALLPELAGRRTKLVVLSAAR
jgi:dienelactone hydrolase